MSSIGVIGFLILAVSKSAPLSYFAVFLGAGGIYPCISNTITWVGNNCDGVYRRGITLGAVIAWGNLNGGNLPCLGFSSSFKSCLATFTEMQTSRGIDLATGWFSCICPYFYFAGRWSTTFAS